MRSPQEMMMMIEKLKMDVRALRAQLEENGIKPNIAAFRSKDESVPTTAASIIDQPEVPEDLNNQDGIEEEKVEDVGATQE